MSQTLKTIAVAGALAIGSAVMTQAAEREQVRMVINLIAGVKMPFPETCATTWRAPNACSWIQTVRP